MRICHISDIHWRGYQRHAEYTKAFEKAFETMRALEPDIIINTGDTFHTKTQNISPEVIEKLAWMIRGMTAIAPTYTLLGNHDGNLANAHRQDILSPIHSAMNDKNHFLLKQSGMVDLQESITLHAFSPFDKDGWENLKPVEGKTNVALFHGCIAGSKTDGNFYFNHGEREMADFAGYDFLLLGDIHLSQNCGYRADKNGKMKPWAAYAGSFIQQNFGENEEKGFLVWDIHSKDDWNTQFVPVSNDTPFVTCEWKGNIKKTISHLKAERGERAFLPGARYRFQHKERIPQSQVQLLGNEMKKHNIGSVSFQFLTEQQPLSSINTGTMEFQKVSLRNDPDNIHKLFKEFLAQNQDKYQLTEVQSDVLALSIIRNYLSKLHASEPEAIRNVNWSIKSMEFDNLFRYGKGNKINFENLDGLIGIFGPNRAGKSSIVGSLMYGLFNTSDRGPIKNSKILNRGANDGFSRLCLSINNTDYVIERKTERLLPKRKKVLEEKDMEKSITSLELYKMMLNVETGEYEKSLLTSINRDDTDKEIRRLIGTADDFMLTAFSNQGNINAFINEGATQRKKILSRFLDLDIFEKLYSYAKDDLNITMDKCKVADLSETQLETNQKQLAEVIVSLKETNEMLQWKREQKTGVEDWLREHQTVDAIDPAEIQKKEDKLSNLQDEEKSLVTQLSEVESKLDVTLSDIGAYELQVKLHDFQELQDKLKEALKVEEGAKELERELHRNNNILELQEKSVKKLATVPCGDNFPDCRFIKDSHQDAKLIKKQKQIIEDLKEELSSLSLNLNLFSKSSIEKDIKTFEKATRNLENLRSNKQNLKMKKENISLRLSTVKEKIQDLSKIIENDRETLSKQDTSVLFSKQEEMRRITTELEALEKKKDKLLQEQGALEVRVDTAKEQLQQVKASIEAAKLYRALADALSKTGVPSLVLKTQMPAINTELSKLLMSIQDFNVSLDVDLTSNSMDVFIEDTNSKREIELASGAEKMIASLALRVALLNLSSLPKPDLFIIDEGFGALDEQSLQMCMEFLDILKLRFKSVLLITHVSPLKEIVDSLIEIKVSNDTSSVEC